MDWPRPLSVKNHCHNIQLFDLKCPGECLENIYSTFLLRPFSLCSSDSRYGQSRLENSSSPYCHYWASQFRSIIIIDSDWSRSRKEDLFHVLTIELFTHFNTSYVLMLILTLLQVMKTRTTVIRSIPTFSRPVSDVWQCHTYKDFWKVVSDGDSFSDVQWRQCYCHLEKGFVLVGP